MPVTAAATKFHADVLQCEQLIAKIHMEDGSGRFLFSEADRKQVTEGAFLNLFIAWEHLLENLVANYLTGQTSRTGALPVKFASPDTLERAKGIIIGPNKYFDYGNQEIFKKMVRIFFDGGRPFEPHITGVTQDLSDMRTIRNACAHVTSTTQVALEALAQRLLGTPRPGIEAYTLVTSIDPSGAPGQTIFATYKDKLAIVADLLADG